MAKAAKPPAPKTGSPSEDLIPRSMLPECSVIPEWRQFGYGTTGPAVVPKPAPKKGGKAGGGVIKSSASKRADGIAQRGKTRGRIV